MFVPLHTIQYNAIHLIAHGISGNLFLLLALSDLVRLHARAHRLIHAVHMDKQE